MGNTLKEVIAKEEEEAKQKADASDGSNDGSDNDNEDGIDIDNVALGGHDKKQQGSDT